MMHRPMAGADGEPIGGGDGVGDVVLGFAHGLGQCEAFGESRRDRR